MHPQLPTAGHNYYLHSHCSCFHISQNKLLLCFFLLHNCISLKTWTLPRPSSEDVDVVITGTLLAQARISGPKQNAYCVKRLPYQDYQPSLPTPFYSVLVSISVCMALSTVFHSINSSGNSLRFLTLFFRSYLSVLLVLSTLYLFLKVSLSSDTIPSG